MAAFDTEYFFVIRKIASAVWAFSHNHPGMCTASVIPVFPLSYIHVSAYTINTDNENLISQTIQLYKIIHHITAIYNQKNPADCLGAVKKRASAAQKKAPKGFS